MSRDPEKKEPGAVVRRWWERALGGKSEFDNGAAKKARAQLRRASSPSEVLAVEAVHELRVWLAEARLGRDLQKDPLRLALIAVTVAAIKENSPMTLPRRFGERTGSEKDSRYVLSPLRFQRILHAGDDWELAIRLRRALPLVRHTANVDALGADLFFWGDNIRNRWCFDYFGTPPPDSLAGAATEHSNEPENEDA